jgi:hypothetical protein
MLALFGSETSWRRIGFFRRGFTSNLYMAGVVVITVI